MVGNSSSVVSWNCRNGGNMLYRSGRISYWSSMGDSNWGSMNNRSSCIVTNNRSSMTDDWRCRIGSDWSSMCYCNWSSVYNGSSMTDDWSSMTDDWGCVTDWCSMSYGNRSNISSYCVSNDWSCCYMFSYRSWWISYWSSMSDWNRCSMENRSGVGIGNSMTGSIGSCKSYKEDSDLWKKILN